MNKQRIVALLPMKANSQRVAGKNFKDFNGKPLFRWILDTLLSIKDIDCVVINTDAREILAKNGLVENDKIIIRDRRPEICGDMVSMNLIIEDDIENIDADIYIMTHTTNPLVKSETIRSALNLFRIKEQKGEADSLFSVDKIQTRFYRGDCSPVNHDPGNLLRTQDLEPWYEENSNFYFFTKKAFRITNGRIGKNPIMFETPKLESIDIDTPDDWNFGLIAAKYLINNQ